MTNSLLEGVRILDLTSVIVGPACTLRLASYGATVTKIEAPEGDLMRTLGGPSPTGQHAGTYLHLNRGKRGIALDLKHPDAAAAIDRLLAASDVFVTNLRPEALVRLGLDPAAVRHRHARLVHCTITGFGPGPYRGRPAYDSVVQGASGIAGLFAARDGTPSYVPLMMADHVVGEIAAGAIVAAVCRQIRTGVGATIEVPMFETLTAMVLQEHLGPASFDPPLGGVGDRRILSAYNRPMATADGWISLTANTDAQALALLRAMGREDLLDDPRFATAALRFRHVDDWFSIRTDALKQRRTADWLRILGEHDIPCMPCHTLDTLLDDPHLQAVGLVEPAMEHPREGRIRQVRTTVLVDGETSEGGRSRPAGPVGADSRDVLQEAGYTEAEVAALLACGAAHEDRSND
ncbi:MAG: CoA transferase [Ottowia sp.]|uniref:CaiB/BaiF CoA transferase family protein n=1 Tax=Ottowia sp. TaxID=1898956 RepID=UPI003C729FC9